MILSADRHLVAYPNHYQMVGHDPEEEKYLWWDENGRIKTQYIAEKPDLNEYEGDDYDQAYLDWIGESNLVHEDVTPHEGHQWSGRYDLRTGQLSVWSFDEKQMPSTLVAQLESHFPNHTPYYFPRGGPPIEGYGPYGYR